MKNSVYTHYKGASYLVLGTALHTESNEELVLYSRVGEERVFARPVAMFHDNVIVDGVKCRRFRKIDYLESTAGEQGEAHGLARATDES